MAVASGAILRVDVLGDMGTTEDIVNTYQFQYVSGSTASEDEVLTDLIELLRALYDALKAIMSGVTVWRRIRAYQVDTGLLVGEKDFTTPVTGTAAGNQGAFQQAGLVVFKTAYSRVSLRKYLPVSASVTDGAGRITSAAQTILNTYGTTLLSNMTAASGRVYRFGYRSPKAGFWVLPQNRSTSAVVATQRRRRPGVGS